MSRHQRRLNCYGIVQHVGDVLGDFHTYFPVVTTWGNRELNTDIFPGYRGEGIVGTICGGGKGPGSERHFLANKNFCLCVIQRYDARRGEQVGNFPCSLAQLRKPRMRCRLNQF